jgi:DHA3 family multidrug efflux protein-like MFS transporter
MALIFIVAGVIGLVVTLAALRSRPYRDLSRTYAGATSTEEPGRPVVEEAIA